MGITKANFAIGYGVVQIGGSDVGGTEGGMHVRMETTYAEFTCDQFPAIVDKVPVFRRMFVSGTMSQLDQAKLLLLWHIVDTALATLVVTFRDTKPSSATAVTFISNGPNGKNWTWLFSDCAGLSTGELAMNKETKSIQPFEFEVIPAISGIVAEFGTLTQAA